MLHYSELQMNNDVATKQSDEIYERITFLQLKERMHAKHGKSTLKSTIFSMTTDAR